MKKLEFTTVMNEIRGIGRKKVGTDYNYELSNIMTFSFRQFFCTLVKGEIPTAVVQAFYEAYPNDLFPRSFASKIKNLLPSALANNENMYKLYGNVYKEIEAKPTNFEPKRKKLEVPVYDCEINTKEELLAFLAQLAHYYRRKDSNYNLLSNINPSQLLELMAEINTKLIEAVNPYVTTRDWLYKRIPSLLMEKQEGLSEQDQTLRTLSEEFDVTANPFINDSYNMVSPVDYNNKVRLVMDRDDSLVEMSIIGSQTPDKVDYVRADDMLSYSLSRFRNKSIETLPYFTIQHCFLPKTGHEHICVWDKGDITDYNLTTSKVRKNHGNEMPITDEDKDLLISKLKKSINAAGNVTISNMCEPKVLGNMKKRRESSTVES